MSNFDDFTQLYEANNHSKVGDGTSPIIRSVPTENEEKDPRVSTDGEGFTIDYLAESVAGYRIKLNNPQLHHLIPKARSELDEILKKACRDSIKAANSDAPDQHKDYLREKAEEVSKVFRNDVFKLENKIEFNQPVQSSIRSE